MLGFRVIKKLFSFILCLHLLMIWSYVCVVKDSFIYKLEKETELALWHKIVYIKILRLCPLLGMFCTLPYFVNINFHRLYYFLSNIYSTPFYFPNRNSLLWWYATIIRGGTLRVGRSVWLFLYYLCCMKVVYISRFI